MTGKVFKSSNGMEIIIDQVDGFGKNPGLWVKQPDSNVRIKMASFGSEKKAKIFILYLAEFCGAVYEPNGGTNNEL